MVEDHSDVLDITINALQDAVNNADGRSLMVRLEFIGATSVYGDFSKKFAKISDDILEASPDIMGNGAVIKICQSCRPAIDLALERSRPLSMLGNLLLDLDAKPKEEVDDELRLAVELLLVNALHGSK